MIEKTDPADRGVHLFDEIAHRGSESLVTLAVPRQGALQFVPLNLMNRDVMFKTQSSAPRVANLGFNLVSGDPYPIVRSRTVRGSATTLGFPLEARIVAINRVTVTAPRAANRSLFLERFSDPGGGNVAELG